MVTQVTVSPSFQAKMDKLDELVGEKIEEKLVSLGNYAIEISPVYSGAFVNSWSLRPIGSGGGRSRTSKSDRSPNPQAEKEEAKRKINADAKTYSKQIADKGGAILTNRAPHAKEVDQKYLTITRVRDRFR